MDYLSSVFCFSSQTDVLYSADTALADVFFSSAAKV